MEFLRSAYQRVDQSLIAPTIDALRRIPLPSFRTAQRNTQPFTSPQGRTLRFPSRSPSPPHHPTTPSIPEVVHVIVRSPTVISKKFGKRIPGQASRPPRRRALLIACGYYDSPEADMKLSFSWKDIVTTWKLLTTRGYRETDITILMDLPLKVEEIPPDLTQFLWILPKRPCPPTKKQILREFHRLVKGTHAGDRLFVQMSGHGNQQPATTSDPYEKDRMDEYFYPCDYHKHLLTDERGGTFLCRGGKLLDNTIRQVLVDPLPEGAELFGVFDFCSSGTILDLPYEAERNEESCRITATLKQARKIFSLPQRCSTLPPSPIRQLEEPVGSSFSRRRTLPVQEPGPSEPVVLPKSGSTPKVDQEGRYGRLITQPKEDNRRIKAKFVSIASCRDGGRTFETMHGGALVMFLSQLLTENPNLSEMTYGRLHDRLKYRLQKQHDDMKRESLASGQQWDEKWQAPVPMFCYSYPEWSWDDRVPSFHSL